MCVFTHSKQPLEKYEAPLYFPPVEMNHALLTKTFRSEWDVPIEKLRKGLMKGQLFQQMLKYYRYSFFSQRNEIFRVSRLLSRGYLTSFRACF